MNTVNITLEEMLTAREQRLSRQATLLRRYQRPLVSLSMNIAGPVKRTPLIDFAFAEALRRIHDRCGTALYEECVRRPTGCEALLVFDRSAAALKDAAVAIENEDTAGRLFDIDVLDERGQKLSRTSARTCLVCGGPVLLCSRSRAHTLEVVQEKTQHILMEFAQEHLSSLAVDALLAEARLTPKPGLVDARNSGAHSDMDLALLEKSAYSLEPFFRQAVQLGMHSPDCMPTLQGAGLQAEHEMFSATGGVNTHKGALYSLGLLCAAIGQSLITPCDIFALAARLAAAGARSSAPSHGSRVAQLYSAGGAREEAERGFPHVQKALSVLRSGGDPFDALLVLLASVEDTNLLWRGGAEALGYVRAEAARILAAPREQRISLVTALDDAFIKQHLSPGGSADLLSAALFLYNAGISESPSFLKSKPTEVFL